MRPRRGELRRHGGIALENSCAPETWEGKAQLVNPPLLESELELKVSCNSLTPEAHK